MAGDHNGIPLELGLLLGKFDAILSRQILLSETLHESSIRQEATSERQEAILERMDSNIAALPGRLSEIMQASATRPKTGFFANLAQTTIAAKEIMPPLKEIVWALIILAASLGFIAPQNLSPHGPTPQMQLPE